ncbi:hypothetical protein MAM1_0249d08719 [Mucor ambiguus]|uniref:Uncharacterized protein n=1 Tax=Mucor ambiguus TaxID=91626 RepID=A0A0C9MZW0_9FUNG|nr:hypothetical protein MAM1_0249d08719 [Mucor ambiguus]
MRVIFYPADQNGGIATNPTATFNLVRSDNAVIMNGLKLALQANTHYANIAAVTVQAMAPTATTWPLTENEMALASTPY